MKRKAYPLNAKNYRRFSNTLHNNEELREKMAVPTRLAIQAMEFSGLRPGEAISMRDAWHDVGSSGMVIRVPDGDISGGGFEAKTVDGSRSVPAPEKFECHFRDEAVGIEYPDVLRGYFATSDKVAISLQTLRYWVHEVARLAEIDRPKVSLEFGRRGRREYPDLVSHDLRASWCAQCLRSNVNRYTVRDWGGWANLEMVNRYAKYVGDPSGREAQKF